MPSVSVVVLCYKAGENAKVFTQQIVETLASFTQDWEIVLVGNYHKGELDPTPEIVQNIASQNPRIKAVVLEKQGMMGWDARKGLEAASGDILVLIDGDRQMPANDVLMVLRLFKETQCDLAMTYRSNRHDGLARVINSRVYNLLFRMLFPGYAVRDVNSKPKAMRRELYDKLELTSDDWFLDAEIVIKARRHKAQLAQIPTVFLRNESRKSFVRADAIIEFIWNLLRARVKELFGK